MTAAALTRLSRRGMSCADQLGHEVVLGPHDHVQWRGVLDHFSLAHDGDAVGQECGLVDIVGDEDDRLPQAAMEFAELELQPRAGDGVQGAKWLIHEQRPGGGSNGAGNADALLLSAGKLGRIAGSVLVGRQTDEVKQFVDALRDLFLVPAQELRHDGDVLSHGVVRKETALLDDVPHVPSQVRTRELLRRRAVDVDRAFGGVVEPVDQFQERGLATTGRTNKHRELARLDREVDVVDGRHRAVRAVEPLADVLEPDLGTGG